MTNHKETKTVIERPPFLPPVRENLGGPQQYQPKIVHAEPLPDVNIGQLDSLILTLQVALEKSPLAVALDFNTASDIVELLKILLAERAS